jgi:colanic acid/amylovoran biosynthesis glycosyltransferase
VAYFVMRHPLLTQTFIDREMRALRDHGLEMEVHPIWDWHNREVAAEGGPRVVRSGFVRICFHALVEAGANPRVVWQGLRAVARHWPGFAEGWFMSIWGGIFALGSAAEFRARAARGEGVDWLHGAWATAPATAALGLSRLLGVPFSFGAHAYDLYRRGGDPLLPLKLRRARFVHTTTQANVESIQARFPDRTTEILLARRGLPEVPPLTAAKREATMDSARLRLLSVGRLVEKKGHAHQLAVCAELRRRGVGARLRIIGEGPGRSRLEARIRELGLASSVTLDGAQAPGVVQRAYDEADIFLHTGIVDAEGDRDGLPNVIPEAMARGLCVISSSGGGAAEAIEHEITGLLVDPTDAGALADAVTRLSGDPDLRAALRTNAHRWVAENFLAATNTAKLATAMRGQAASGR